MAKKVTVNTIKKMKETQNRITEIQNQAQQMQMQADRYLGTQQDITSMGQYGNDMINQVMPI